MNGDFFNTTIGEQLTLQRGFDITKAHQKKGNIPVVSSGGISSFHDTAMVQGPGVVLGRKGSLGTVFYINEDYWPHDTSLWVKDFKGNNPRFIYYFFSSISEELKRMDVGAANPALNRNHVHPIPVKWPERHIQDEIATVLSSIDDKIALNREINQTLEAMAQALFKSWFVDFEPVRAKVAALELGEDPTRAAMRAISGKSDDELDTLQTADAAAYAQLQTTASLFPDEFEESELGMIPKGWEVGGINRLSSLSKKTVCPSNEPDLEYLHYSLPAYDSGMIPNLEFGKEILSNKFIVQNNVILFSKLNPIFPRIWPIRNSVKNSICSTEFLVLVPEDQKYYSFIFSCLTSSVFRDYLIGIASGTSNSHQRVKPNDIMSFKLVIPPDRLLELYQNIILPKLEILVKRIDESNVLSALRDTLLPKLLSGELSVSNSEVEADAIG